MSRYNLSILFFLLQILVQAQEIQVLNETTGEPIEDVAIFSIDQKNYTNTNENGIFELSLFPSFTTIVFQHPSFYSMSISKKDILKNGDKISLTERIIKIDEVVISANRWEQNKSEIPYEILSISAKKMSFANPQTSADMLVASGQVFVQKSQLGGGSPMIRGFGANSVLIVVDGVRMNNAIFRGGNLQNVISIDPNTLESSEVIFGPGAVIYGSDALGGVMDFHTIKPKYANGDELLVKGHGLARYSSANNEKTVNALVSLSKSNFSYLGSLTVSDFGDLKTGSVRPDDHPDFGKRPEYIIQLNGVDTIVSNADENLQIFSGYKQLSALQKVQFRIKDHLELGYTLNFSTTSNIPRYDRLIEYDGENLKNAEWYYGPQKWMMHALRLNYFKVNRLFDQAKFITAFQQFEESRHDRKYRQFSLRNRTEKVDVLLFNVNFEKIFENSGQLFYGLEYSYSRVNSTAFAEDIETGEISQISTRYPNGGNDVHNVALYASYKKNIVKKIILNTGIRYSYQSLTSKFNGNSFEYDKIENTNASINGNVGMVFKPNQKWNISGLLSSGFRAPNVDDISKVFDSEPGNVVVPNPSLKPEYSYNAEVSTSWILNENILINGTLFYSILYDAMVRGDFSIDGKDSIIYDGVMSKVQAIVNTGRANIYGFNAMLKIDLSRNWSTSFNINYTQGIDLINNEPLRHTTPLFGKASLFYNQKKIRGEFFLCFNGKREFKDLPPSERNKPHLYTTDGSLAWYTLNIRMQYKVNNIIGINGAIENILDHHYRPYASGISASGRNFVISIKAVI